MSLFEEDKALEKKATELESAPKMPMNESLLPPRESTFCIGHEVVESRLLDLILKEKLPHALILTGARGIGKATFAFRLSRYLLKNGVPSSGQNLFGDTLAQDISHSLEIDSDDPVFTRLRSGGHPDFRYYAPQDDKKNLDIDQIREISIFLHKRASEGGWRVVIVDEAERMSRNAQNALLKILEEPPTNSLICMVCNQASQLLATIRSRSQVRVLMPLPPPQFETVLRRYCAEISQQDLDNLFALSEGSPGKAIAFLDQNGLVLLSEVRALLQTFPSFNYEQVHLFCERFAKGSSEDLWRSFENTLLWIFQSLIQSKARTYPLPPYLTTLAGMQDSCTLEDLVKIWQHLAQHLKQINLRNLDKRQGALEAFFLIERKGS